MQCAEITVLTETTKTQASTFFKLWDENKIK